MGQEKLLGGRKELGAQASWGAEGPTAGLSDEGKTQARPRPRSHLRLLSRVVLSGSLPVLASASSCGMGLAWHPPRARWRGLRENAVARQRGSASEPSAAPLRASCIVALSLSEQH